MEKVSGSRAVWWESHGVTTNAAEVIDAGLGDWVKTPQYRGYLRKAIDTVLRDYSTIDSKKTRQYFPTGDGGYRYVIVHIQTSDDGVETDGSSIYVDSRGRLSCDAELDGTELYDKILAEYRRTSEQSTLQGADISQMIKNFVKRELIGMSIKKGGGLWLVSDDYQESYDFIREATTKLGVSWDDIDFDGNEDTIAGILKRGFSEEGKAVYKDLVETTKKVDRDELTEHQIEARFEKTQKALDRLETKKDELKDGYFELRAQIKEIEAAMEKAGGKKESFLELLGALGEE